MVGFTIPKPQHVRIIIYDSMGHIIRRLVDRHMGAGFHQVEWDGRNDKGELIASGVYFYQLSASKQVVAKKMILLR